MDVKEVVSCLFELLPLSVGKKKASKYHLNLNKFAMLRKSNILLRKTNFIRNFILFV